LNMFDNHQQLLESQLRRTVTNLFKQYLVILEDIRQEQLQIVAELSSQFPAEFVQKVNSLDLPRYSRLRKKVLDLGNDSLREMQSILDDFKISIDNKKV
jgi:hypothetical protein